VPGAISAKLRPAGTVAIDPSAGTDRYSACAPNAPSLYPNTRSPTAKDVTPAPTASTSPAYSVPRIVRRGRTRPTENRTRNGVAVR
jgi:hypothetical protein